MHTRWSSLLRYTVGARTHESGLFKPLDFTVSASNWTAGTDSPSPTRE